MQVILKKDVQNLGEAGDIVNVKDGYARNFLLPQDVAECATEGALKNREQNLARIKAKQFGTITTKKLTEELQAKSGIEVDRKTVTLNAPINKIGEYTMLIKLTSKVKCEVPVKVSASEVVKESVVEEEETSTEE